MTLKDMLDNGSAPDVAIYRKLYSDPVWRNAGFVEVEVLNVNEEHRLVKLQYNTTIKTHIEQGVIVWVDIDKCNDLEFITIV